MRLRGLSDLRLEFREPYPIYRGLRVPVWEGGRPVAVRRVADEDRKAFAEAMQRLRSLLKKVSNLASGLGLSEAERLSLLADAIAAFFKAPLIQEVISVAPTPLKAHALSLLAPKLRKELWSEDLYEYAKRLASFTGEELRFAEELFGQEAANLVYRLWIAFPADTRPGYNTSGLIAHLLMTSAIAWALRRKEGKVGGDEEARIRLAALLHDLGKAVDPERHYEASEKLARDLLKGLVDEKALESIATTIREHHRKAEPSQVLSEADQLASASDRLEKIVKDERTIGGKLAKIRDLIGKVEDEWAFWRAVHEEREKLVKAGLVKDDPIKGLTEEFLAKVSVVVKDLKWEELAKPVPDISLVLVDVTSIQGFIFRSQEVRIVAAASHLIELLVHAHFLDYLRNKGLHIPPEAVIYAGGGNILLLLPKGMTIVVEKLAREYGEKNGFKLVVASAPFCDSYVAASKILANKMFVKKHEVELLDSPDLPGLSGQDFCRTCYGDWAQSTIETPEGPRSVCGICKKLYNVGSDIHFKSKWEATINVAGTSFKALDAFNVEWERISQWIIEVIAGHDPEELQEGVGRVRDYAIVKFDGNAIGSFMLEAISFTDAIERSFRVDMAMKKAYFKALEALYKGIEEVVGHDKARREVARVVLGTIYMGGDDGFVLTPSWIAVPFAHFIAEEFSRQLGLERGLKVAVAAGPAKMNIWALLDCASKMMEEAGSVLRREDPTTKEVLGAIAFDIFEAGSPSGASAVERMRRFSRRARGELKPRDENIDRQQPYFIKRQDLEGSTIPELWSSLVPLVLGVAPPNKWSDDEAFGAYVEAFKRAYLASRTEKTEIRGTLSDVRNAILRSWGVVSGSKYWREKLLVYLCRQMIRGEGESSRRAAMEKAYKSLAEFVKKSLSMEGMGLVPIADALTLIKLVKGGAW
jgi:putative nucleotidyltransferase with HDIG domain